MDPGLSVTVLVDNHTLIDRYYLGEPGLSIVLEQGTKKILFDTGYSDVFLRNADRMGIDLLDLDHIVLSHGHLDHTGGLEHLIRLLTEAQIEKRPFHSPELIAHPFCFYPRPKPPLANIGSPISEERARMLFPLRLSREPVWITDRLVFLGEIPRHFAFEREPSGDRIIRMPEGVLAPDPLLDDSAMAYRSPEGIVLLTGCSHAGICNIVEYAREICGDRRILDIIGGLHLREPDRERMARTCEYLKAAGPRALHACHCASFLSRVALSTVCPVMDVGVGLHLEYP